MGRLARVHGLVEPIRERAQAGMPVLGTCAGMIVMAREIVGGEPLLELMDIRVARNAYGCQVDLRGGGGAARLRGGASAGRVHWAPVVEELGEDVRILAQHDGRPVAVEEGTCGGGVPPRAHRRAPPPPAPAREGGLVGHPWSSIKHKKAATDQRRGKMFSKLLRAVEVAAEGGGNIEANATLASAVQKARDFSVPMENIERAIKRGELRDRGGPVRDRGLRGLRPRRCRGPGRDAHRQPEPEGQDVRHTFT